MIAVYGWYSDNLYANAMLWEHLNAMRRQGLRPMPEQPHRHPLWFTNQRHRLPLGPPVTLVSGPTPMSSGAILAADYVQPTFNGGPLVIAVEHGADPVVVARTVAALMATHPDSVWE